MIRVMAVIVGRLNRGPGGVSGVSDTSTSLGFVLIWIFIVMFYKHPWGLKFTFLIKIKHTQKKFLLVILSLDIKGLFKRVIIKLVESHEEIHIWVFLSTANPTPQVAAIQPIIIFVFARLLSFSWSTLFSYIAFWAVFISVTVFIFV